MDSDICVFISTFKQRSKVVDWFCHYYKKSEINLPLYIFNDEEIDRSSDLITHVRDSYSADGDLSQTSCWGKRLKEAIQHLKEKYKYAIFTVDDGLFVDIDIPRFQKIFEIVKKNNVGYYSLQHDFVGGDGLSYQKIEDDLLLVDYHSLNWYLTHQTSLWDLDILDKLVYADDISAHNEFYGYSRMVEKGIRLHQYEGKKPFNTPGIMHCTGKIFDEYQKYIENLEI